MFNLRNVTIEFLERMKALDIFGYRVTLYVDKKNYTHKTICGSFASIIYLTFVAIIFFFLTEHALLDLISPLYDVNANFLTTKRRMQASTSSPNSTQTQLILTNQEFVISSSGKIVTTS